MAMKKVEIPMFLHRKADGSEKLLPFDSSKSCGDPMFNLNHYGACMGQVIVVGEYQGITGDPIEKAIEGLEAAKIKERGDSCARITALDERIHQLKCISHDAG